MSNSDRRSEILVIDDNARCRESLVSILELEGYQVACAVHGLEALSYLRREPLPSLLLLDLVAIYCHGPGAERSRGLTLPTIGFDHAGGAPGISNWRP